MKSVSDECGWKICLGLKRQRDEKWFVFRGDQINVSVFLRKRLTEMTWPYILGNISGVLFISGFRIITIIININIISGSSSSSSIFIISSSSSSSLLLDWLIDFPLMQSVRSFAYVRCVLSF